MTRPLVHLDIAEQPAVVRAALAANDDALGLAAQLVERATVVRLLAIGSSRHAAGYGAAALEELTGVPATVLPAPGAAVPPPSWRVGHVAIAVSQSGHTPSLVAAVRAARAASVPVIVITNGADSPLADLADVALSCGAGPERVIAATKSVTAQALLLRAVAEALPPRSVDSLGAALDDVMALDVGRVVRGAVPATVVCSGFAAEWIADEIALKFAEMAGVAVTAEPLVEHLHGPVAAGGAVLAFVDPADPNAAALPGSALVVGPGAPDLALPTTGDPSLDAIVSLVAGQRIVAAWAERLGEDPDATRGLQKVTVTR